MNAPLTPVVARRRKWPWILGLCLAPFVVLGATVCSFLLIDRDAVFLREQIMHHAGGKWDTKIQLNVGRFTVGAVRTGLAFVQNPNLADAKLALRAVKSASVGVYQSKMAENESDFRARLFTATDQGMRKRGWARIVGVADGDDVVLVYAPAADAAGDSMEVCVSVLNRRELVVVSATVDSAGLAELVQKHAGDSLNGKLQFAQF